MFRVELDSLARQRRDGPAVNPFRIRLDLDSRIDMLVRTWEFEADNEAHVRQLLQEAYDADVPGVCGFKLRSITDISKGK